ncbi:elongation factor 1-alpha (ef-1-alpha) [Trypanosoma theileri]|uniref:Elongation factor 1-alpha (Ef-1-alpha) n=1 Tax=Trypanosoma theileri TaxID=67003 RepID=A0A1X0NYT2_9TRYP|nr:elongation factor 1-alpha (ef-1-alpha) [Trypanosoma theileri]ORC89369.1 elongation factor 1-alpha (ef-1-alpha) [Trypanosoma theileri]
MLEGAAPSGAAGELRSRQRRRRQRLAASPQSRRARLQYRRRHNERDGRVYYCDYCDLFVSSAGRSWTEHLRGVRHMESVEMYYAMLERREAAWLDTIRADVQQSHVESYLREHQKTAGRGAAMPMPPTTTGFVGNCGIVVGGIQPSVHLQTAIHNNNNTTTIGSSSDSGSVMMMMSSESGNHSGSGMNNNNNKNNNNNSSNSPNSVLNGSPSVRVGGFLVSEAKPPLITINGKSVPPIQLEQHVERKN